MEFILFFTSKSEKPFLNMINVCKQRKVGGLFQHCQSQIY